MPGIKETGIRCAIHIQFPNTIGNNVEKNYEQDTGAITVNVLGSSLQGEAISWYQDESEAHSTNCSSILCFIISGEVEMTIPKGESYSVEIRNLLNPTSIAPFGELKISILMRYQDEIEWSKISGGKMTSPISVKTETLD